jgi:hypothetical protein
MTGWRETQPKAGLPFAASGDDISPNRNPRSTLKLRRGAGASKPAVAPRQ